MVRAASWAAEIAARQEDLPDGELVAAGFVACAPDLLLEKSLRDLHVDARAVAGLAVRVDRAAMPDRLERLDAVVDDLAARLSVQRHDEPDAARGVLVLGAVHSGGFQPGVFGFHPRDPGRIIFRHLPSPAGGGANIASTSACVMVARSPAKAKLDVLRSM